MAAVGWRIAYKDFLHAIGTYAPGKAIPRLEARYRLTSLMPRLKVCCDISFFTSQID